MQMFTRIMLMFGLVALMAASSPAFADVTSTHYKILNPTISPGGTGSSASYQLSATQGEVAHNGGSSSSYKLQLGFFSFPVVTVPVVTAQVGNVDQEVELSWSASIPYLGYTVSGYSVGYSTASGGPYTLVNAGNTLTYNVTGLTDNTPYYFIVRAYDNANIVIATSSEITATPVAPSLTFVLDTNSASLPTITPGTLVATSTILSVKTNNTNGFVTTLVRSNVSGTLTHADATTFIPDKTDWVAPVATTSTGNATASTTEPLSLQFRLWKALTDTPNYAASWWGADDTSSGALFAGIPSTTQTIANRSIPALSTTTMRVLYDLNVPATQKTGTYNGDVIYSVTANP